MSSKLAKYLWKNEQTQIEEKLAQTKTVRWLFHEKVRLFWSNFWDRQMLRNYSNHGSKIWKTHELVGIDVWRVDTTKLFNSVKIESNDAGILEGYKARIQWKENSPPS